MPTDDLSAVLTFTDQRQLVIQCCGVVESEANTLAPSVLERITMV
jgi:hypothetical protein